MTLELSHRRKKKSSLTHFDLYSELNSLMIQVSRHVLQNEQTRCHLTQNITHVRFKVNAYKAGKIKKNLGYVKNTHTNCSWGSFTSWPGKTRALFLDRATLFPVLAPDKQPQRAQRLYTNLHYRNFLPKWKTELEKWSVMLISQM